MTNLTECPIGLDRAELILGETPIGFKAITDCDNEGCLAPGSSPHSHSVITHWMLVGATGLAWVDAKTDMVTRACVLHHFPEGT